MTVIAPARTDSIAVAARLFRSLGDPTRLAVLLSVAAGEKRVTDLVREVGGSQSNVSAHVACLKACGLVADRPDVRRQVFYSIADPAIHDVLDAAERLLTTVGAAIAGCRGPAPAGPDRRSREPVDG